MLRRGVVGAWVGLFTLAAIFALAILWLRHDGAVARPSHCIDGGDQMELLICDQDELSQANTDLVETTDKTKPVLVESPITPPSSVSPVELLASPIEEKLPTVLGLDRDTVPARGDQHSILSVAQFGRYSVSVKSNQGVALQLVDRMAGPGPIDGAPGVSDGRVDAFLDRGHYKIRLHADEQGTGEASIAVRGFDELNGPDIPRLPEIKRIDTDLADYQQRSYWLEITSRQVVAIEAAGRNLADMRLWRDGTWLIDAVPTSDKAEPEPGKPFAVRRLVATLEPGFYLLSAYGGPALPWAKTSDAHPFHLRMGIPRLDEAGRLAFKTSPFGVDRFLVPAQANYFRIELPEAEPAELSVGTYVEEQPFGIGQTAAISKKTIPPIAEIRTSSGDTGYKVITIHRESGKSYVLQHFKAVNQYSFNGADSYWIASLHSGFGEDNIDATGLLTQYSEAVSEKVIASNAPELDTQSVWARRFNLLEPVTVYFHVTQVGNYVVSGSGAKSEYRFEPFIHIGADYKAPQFQPSGFVWQLDPGYYVLTGQPIEDGKGILDIRVAAEGVTGEGGPQAKETAVLFPRELLNSDLGYTLYLNEQPGVEAGVVLRRLPIDLTAGLPLVLKAGQSLDVPVTAPKYGLVTASGEDTSALSFNIDGGALVAEWRGDGAQHTLTIANTTNKAFSAALRYTPDSLAPDTPLLRISSEDLAAIPDFPELVPQQARFFDIARAEQKNFTLDVAEPGLYRVESTGLLQTEGNMRTRTITSFDRQASNGTGRNFLLQQYLGQGHYQVSIASQGETHGRMGVSATRTTLTDGGVLSLNVPARDTILSGDGLLYTFRITEAGQYRLRALGLGRTYKMRLEDGDGWPIISPNEPANLTMDFKPGIYRLVILPQPVDAKIVTLLEWIKTAVPVEGHGPHDLALNQPQNFQWREPEASAERVPDQWRITLPAAAHVAIDLSRGMRADLIGTDGSTRYEVIGGETWRGELPAGNYTLQATTFEPNNRFDYQITVTTEELVAGESRVISLPTDIPVSIGNDSVVEIGSFGVTDVRAWLFDVDGHMVATNDDRPNDWNFAIAGRLQPGYYRLHLEAIGDVSVAPVVNDSVENNEVDQITSDDAEAGDEEAGLQSTEALPGQTTVSIYQAQELVESALAIGKDAQFSGSAVHIVPLTVAAGDLLVAAANADGPAVGLGLERKENGAWKTLSESLGESPWVALPVTDPKDEHRLRVWSVDRSADPIMLQTRMMAQTTAGSLKAGVVLRPVDGIEPALGLAAVAIDAAGAYRLKQPPAGLGWSTEKGRALTSDPRGIVFGDKGTYWFGARLSDGTATVSGSLLTPGASPVTLIVPGSDQGATIITDPVTSKSPSHLWLTESRLGQPGIGAEGLISATAKNSAIAMALETQSTGFPLRLWNAGNPADSLPITLRRLDFAAPIEETLDWGVVDRELKQRQGRSFVLPKGLKRFNLALPPLTAVILRHGETREGIWSGNTALALMRDSSADEVLMLSAANADAQISLSLTPIGAPDATAALGGGRMFKQYFPAEGVVRLDIRLSDSEIRAGDRLRVFDMNFADSQIRAGKELWVMVDGAVTHATLMRADGSVSRSKSPMVGGSNATIDIAHGKGLVVAWIDGGDPLTSPGVLAKGIEVKETASVPLAGLAQKIVFTVTDPKFLRFKTTAPVIVEVEATQRLRAFSNGADLNLLLPKGTTSIVLRAAGEGQLSGLAEASLLDIAPINEGLGPKVRLNPGESRLYSFTVKDERDIGVGVRGAADSAHCRVLDAEGKEVGSGVVQMLHLKAGTYLLAVDAPAEGNAIEVQPALVGIAAPDGSPPDDVKRFYLELAGLKPN